MWCIAPPDTARKSGWSYLFGEFRGVFPPDFLPHRGRKSEPLENLSEKVGSPAAISGGVYPLPREGVVLKQRPALVQHGPLMCTPSLGRGLC
jgi:hypothetical protein